ncbi:hypothetical protein KLP28_09725 [Nocardioidaceae bacterium]|nr:hypothetical protein KLP28_09725 [Nocardioidaceae bacterium]
MDQPFTPRLDQLDVRLPCGIGDVDGPTRGAAYGPRWTPTGGGLFVPTDRPDTPEQRVVERAPAMPPHGAVTGWGALRLRGATYFTGSGRPVDVTVPAHANPRSRPGVRWLRRDLDGELHQVAGLAVVDASMTLLDHVSSELRAGRRREAVVAVDMAMAAQLCSLAGVIAHVRSRRRLPRREQVERVMTLAAAGSASPPESRLRLLWVLDTALPPPLVNVWILDADGRHVAVPDLLEPVSGLVAEYDGLVHAGARRRSRDAEKDDLYRELGLEPVRVTAPDMTRPLDVADRLSRAYARAHEASRPRRWQLGRPFTRAPVMGRESWA